jgi:hypothetical protein
MKKLIPISETFCTAGEFEPSLMDRPFRPGKFDPKKPHKFRPDLDGLVKNQTGPVVEIDECIFMLK